MKLASFLAWAGLLLPALAPAAEPASGGTTATQVPEPKVTRTVIEDDFNRVEELNVRGQRRSIVVTTKGPLAGSYEIHVGDLSRDLGDGPGPRLGVSGQRMWRVMSF